MAYEMTGRSLAAGAGKPVREYANKRHYSVYHKKTDQPLIIYATARECAEAMGIQIKSFYRYVMRMREGKIRLRKWAVYEDEDLEDVWWLI